MSGIFYQDPSSWGTGKDNRSVKTIFTCSRKELKIFCAICIHDHMKELKIEAVKPGGPDKPKSCPRRVGLSKTNSWSYTRKYFSRKKCNRIRRKLEKEGNLGGK